MHTSTILVAITCLFGMTNAAAAVDEPRAINNDLQDAKPGLVARQSAACDTAASSILSSLPTGTGGFGNRIASLLGTGGLISPTRVCQVISALPSSLESEASAYDNSLASWFSSQSSRVNSLVSQCSNDSAVMSLASMTSDLAAYASGCNATTTSGSSGGASSTGTAASGASASSGSGSGATGSSAGGAPKETGFVAGAVLAAGFIGAVALL